MLGLRDVVAALTTVVLFCRFNSFVFLECGLIAWFNVYVECCVLELDA